jgi:hypothetical protein
MVITADTIFHGAPVPTEEAALGYILIALAPLLPEQRVRVLKQAEELSRKVSTG